MPTKGASKLNSDESPTLYFVKGYSLCSLKPYLVFGNFTRRHVPAEITSLVVGAPSRARLIFWNTMRLS